MKEDVIHFEKVLNETNELYQELNRVLKKVEKNRKVYQSLKEYYQSEEYLKDVKKSDETKEYDSIPCGVLSQDEVFDLIGEVYQTSIQMLEVATKVLKEH